MKTLIFAVVAVAVAMHATLASAEATPDDVADFFVRVQAGDIEGVQSALAEHPDLANARSASNIFFTSVMKKALEIQDGQWFPPCELVAPQPLHVAAVFGKIDIIRTLFEAGADINGRVDFVQEGYSSNPNVTALFLATRSKQADVVAEVCSDGADFTLSYAMGENILHHAIIWGLPVSVVEKLLDCVGDVNDPKFVDSRGHSILHHLTGGDHTDVDVLRLLIDRGVHLDTKGHHGTGKTAVQECAMLERAECVELLLKAGAKAEPEDSVNYPLKINELFRTYGGGEL